MTIAQLAERMQSDLDASMRSGWHAAPALVNRASEIGHKCAWHLYGTRKHWERRAMPDLAGMYRMNEGSYHEDRVRQTLFPLGFEIVGSQRAFMWPDYQISGHIDGTIQRDDLRIVVEIKALAQSFSTVGEMLESWWAHRYPAQLAVYMLMDDCKNGLFICKNRTNGQMSFIPIDLLDNKILEIAEAALKRCEEVNHALATETEPSRIPYDPDICGHCDFQSICDPKKSIIISGKFEHPELPGKIEKREALRAAGKEFKALDAWIKDIVKDVDGVVCGDWHITGKRSRNGAWTSTVTKL